MANVIQEEIEFEHQNAREDSVDDIMRQLLGVNVIENEETPTASDDGEEVVFVGTSILDLGVFVEINEIPVIGKFPVRNLSRLPRSLPTDSEVSALTTIFQFDWNLQSNSNMKILAASLQHQTPSNQLLYNALLQEIINDKNDHRPDSGDMHETNTIVLYRKLFSTSNHTIVEDTVLPDIEVELVKELSKPASTRSFSNPELKALPEIIQLFNHDRSYTLSFDFYERLLPGRWFSNLHIELFVSLLMKFASDFSREDPSFLACGNEFTVLPPTIFSLAVKEKGRGALVNYERAIWVHDRRPGSRAKFDGPYRFRKGVDHILCPFNRHGNHWSLLIINGPSHTIVHVDSMWSDGSIMLRIMLFFLGQMAANCIESNCTDTPDWLLHFNAEEWSLYDLGDKLIPQQGNGNDCGVFVCMFMTIYMFMKPPYSILSEDSVTPFKRSVEGFRRKMIRLFFDSSIDADTFEEFLDNC